MGMIITQIIFRSFISDIFSIGFYTTPAVFLRYQLYGAIGFLGTENVVLPGPVFPEILNFFEIFAERSKRSSKLNFPEYENVVDLFHDVKGQDRLAWLHL